MRTYYDIQLGDRTVTKRELAGEELVNVGRYHIAKTLLELGAATVDPLSPANPLIFSAGPFAGSSFSNANRTSVGCKSPLTGGIKEANGGGTFGYGMGQLRIAGFNLHGASPDWVVLHFKKDGSLDFDDARPYLGKGNFEANRMLLARYGKKVATALWAGRRVPGAHRGHRVHRQGPATLAAGRARRRGGGAGQQEGEGDRARPRQDPAVRGSQEDQRVHQGLQQDAARRWHRDELLPAARHHGHGRRAEPDGRAARAQLQRRPAGGREGGRDVQDGRPVHRAAQQRARRRADARVHAGLRDPVQQRLRGRQRQGDRLARRVRDARPARLQLRPHRPRRPRGAERDRQRHGRGHHRDGGHARRVDGGGARPLRRREVHGRLPARDDAGHATGQDLGAGHRACRAALQGSPRAGHQEAGDQRLRPAGGRSHRHLDDGDGAGRRSHGREPAAAQDARDGSERAARAEPDRADQLRGHRLARALHLRPQRDRAQHRVAGQRPQRRARHESHQGVLPGAGARDAEAGARVQPPRRLHREGRRAAGVLLFGAAGAHQPRRALPRAGRALDVRAAAGMTLAVDKPAELQQHVGKELGPSDWMTVDQAIIDKFAHATGDHQWIHVDVERAKKEMPGGKTIAHGYLTLALVPRMAQTLVKVTGRKRGLNYGSNKVRFTNAVPAGSRIRLRSYRIRSVEPVDGNGFRVTSEATV